MAILKRGAEPAVRPAYPADGAAQSPTSPTAGEPTAREVSEIERRAAGLRAEFARRQWDLGGIAYEMAARNYFKLDVLRARAAELQRVDAELGEARRLASIERASAGGDCPRCGSLYGTGAFFCWNCGQPV